MTDLSPEPLGELMSRARRLARRGRYRTAPNPMVGALVVGGGEIVATGYHRRVGGPHAEIEALAQAGSRARGATLVVTLEPCCHQGRTPPCTEALEAAGIARVVASHRDPNPRVAGQGLARLRQAGIEVEVGPGGREAVRLNWKFLVAQTRGRPAVTLKWAMSLDGKIATATGDSQWISAPEARRWSLDLRETHDAILVGIGTVLADDPRLTRRLGRAEGPILRAVLDRRLRLPSSWRGLREEGPVVVYTEADSAAPRRELEQAGAEVLRLDRVTPDTVLADLRARSVQSVLVEGGAGIHGAFVSAGCFDAVAVDCAPLVIGGGAAPSPVGDPGFPTLTDSTRFEDLSVRRRGPDVLMTGFRSGCLLDLYESVGA